MEQLIIFLVLISCGYFFGKHAESKHYKSINEREEKLLDFPTTSRKKPLQNSINVKEAKLVNGSVVVSVDYFKKILARLRGFFGGRISSYETLVDRARREATLRLKESCLDADEIVNLRIETSSISKNARGGIGSVEALAYATAIYYKK